MDLLYDQVDIFDGFRPFFRITKFVPFLKKKICEIEQLFQNLSEKKYFNLFNISPNINILDYIPRQFSLITKNGKYQFNNTLLSETSNVISDILEKSPLVSEYNLDIDDEMNVLGKIEQLYQGKLVFFELKEFPTLINICQTLEITPLLRFIGNQFNTCDDTDDSENSEAGIIMSKDYLYSIFKNQKFQTFTITVGNKDYKCNKYAVYFSKVIRDFLSKNQNSDHFIFECNDENNELNLILDLFNFSHIRINEDNVYSIKELAESLQIPELVEKVDKIINEYENLSSMIDDQQTMIESIENIFDLLFNIDEITSKTVKENILDSFWIKTEEDIQELAAIFLHVIENSYQLHSSILDLLIELDKEKNKSNYLGELLPFIVKKLFDSFGKTRANCSFIYNLLKRGIISKDQLNNQLKKKFNSKVKIDSNLYDWFTIEIMKLDGKLSSKNNNDSLDHFKRMRDMGEPDNEITKSLIHDDVDTFQSIVSQSKMDFTKMTIPTNIYDDFLSTNKKTKFIDYAAAYGSVKCFKYLLLNHATVDFDTFIFAIHGGNTEIIKIISQKAPKMNGPYEHIFHLAKPAIAKHRNDIFDWIFDQFVLNHLYEEELANEFLSFCAESGNAHSYFEIIDKKYDYQYNYINFIEKAASKGFYKLASMIWNVIKPSERLIKDKSCCSIDSFINFNNLSIFKLFLEIYKDNNDIIKNYLMSAIQKDLFKIVKYFFDVHIDDSFRISRNFAFDLLKTSIEMNSCLTIYLIDKFLLINPKVFQESFDFDPLLSEACENGNLEVVKKLSNLTIEICKNKDYTNEFYIAASYNYNEICKFFVDSKLYVNYQQISFDSNKLGNLSKEIFLLMLNNSDPETKILLLFNFMTPSIAKNNNELAEYLLNTNQKCNHEDFINAIKNKNINLVNLILKYNKNPSFINKLTENGSALNVAVINENIEIVKTLLSIPGIDVNLYGKNNLTPFLYSVKFHDVEMVDLFLDYFEKNNIEEYIWQLNKSIKILIHSFPKVQTSNAILILKKILKINSVDVNITHRSEGNTILIASLLNSNLEIAKLLIQDKRTDINKSNQNHLTPLLIAVEKNMTDVVVLLIKHPKFDAEANLLNYSFFISYRNIAKILVSLESLDVNYIDSNHKNYQTTLTNAVMKKDHEKVDLIIKHHSFNKIKSQITKAIMVSIEQKDDKIFKKLLELVNNDINIYIPSESSTLFDFALNKKSIPIAYEIINNPNFKIDQNNIKNSFEQLCKSFNDNKSLDILEKLIEFDEKHLIDFTKLLSNGKSVFTSINYFGNVGQVVQYFIDHGANPNIPDKNGIYPLQYAIKKNSIPFAVTLLKSQKIDLNKKIFNQKTGNSKTYLHYAVRLYSSDILIHLLKCKEIDINATDYNGDTPLIEACKFKKIKNIEALFQMNDLDYLHVNKDGEDALKIAENYSRSEKINMEENTKDSYFKVLMDYFSQIKSSHNNFVEFSFDSDNDDDFINLGVFDDVD